MNKFVARKGLLSLGDTIVPDLSADTIYTDIITLSGDVTITGDADSRIRLDSYSYAESISAGTSAFGQNSHAEGSGTTASGKSSHAEGDNTTASGVDSHAEGSGSIADGVAAHAEGSSQALATASHTEGNSTAEVTAGWSHAEGSSTRVTAFAAHSEGAATRAEGYAAHSEGQLTVASGPYSHTEGQTTVASGSASHAEGFNTDAIGDYSHAAGENSTAAFDNTWIWSDGVEFATTTTNQFAVYASNGIILSGGPVSANYIYTDTIEFHSGSTITSDATGNVTIAPVTTAAVINLSGDVVFGEDIAFENALVQPAAGMVSTDLYLTFSVNGSALSMPLFKGGIGSLQIGEDFIVG